jgi:hypothetical protein
MTRKEIPGMMNTESQLVLDVYESVKELIPQKQREDFAIRLLKSLEDYVSFSEEDLIGEDRYLDSAVHALYDIEEDATDEEDEL